MCDDEAELVRPLTSDERPLPRPIEDATSSQQRQTLSPPIKIIRIYDTFDRGVQVGTPSITLQSEVEQEVNDFGINQREEQHASVEQKALNEQTQSTSSMVMVNNEDVINNNTSYDQEDNFDGNSDDQLSQVESPNGSNNSLNSPQDINEEMLTTLTQHENIKSEDIDTNNYVFDNNDPSQDLSIATSCSSQLDDQTDSQSSSSQSPRSALKSTYSGQSSQTKKKVRFLSVQVYYFGRLQGFTCVPSTGGSTLGMERTHIKQREFSVDEFCWKRSRSQRRLAAERKRLKKMNKEAACSAGNSVGSSNSSESPEISPDDDSSSGSDISDCDFLIVPHTNCKLVPLHRRREILRASGVMKISTSEHNQCEHIRKSREVCGCFCLGECIPEQCSCARAGIGCQVDRYGFPCHCSLGRCNNANGRIEFNAERVRAHQRKTIELVNAEYQQVSMMFLFYFTN